MSGQSLHHPEGIYQPSDYALAAAAAGLIPESGASFATLSGEARTIGQVFLAPGGGLSKCQRQLAQHHSCCTVAIRADRTPAPAPAAFHRATLRWAIQNADRVMIWSAAFPNLADDVAEYGIAAVNGGARFLTTIECSSENVEDWNALVERLRRPATVVEVFGPCVAADDARIAEFKKILGLLD